MKESLAKIDKKLIFRETFSDEQSVRANGGVPTNVVFSQGKAVFNGSNAYIKYNNNLKGVYTVRVRLSSYTTKNSQFIFDFRTSQTVGSGYLYETPQGTLIIQGGGTLYINNVVTTTVTALTKEVVLSGVTLNSISQVIGSYWQLTGSVLATYDLFEIYEGTLTAQEVSNLYNNKRYKQLAPHGEILGTELVAHPIDLQVGYSVNNAVITSSSSFNTIGLGTGGVRKLAFLTIGKYYKLTVSGTSANPVRIYNADSATNQLLTTFGTIIFTAVNTNIYIRTTGDDTISIIEFTVREVLSTANLILDVDAFDGVIKNRLSGGAVGAELVVNGGLEGSYVNGLAPNWTLVRGTASENTVSPQMGTSAQELTNTANSDGAISKTIVIVSGKRYRFSIWIKNTKGTGGLFTESGIQFPTTICTDTNWKNYVYEFTASSNQFYIAIYANTGGLANTNSICFDNVSLREIIPSVIPTAVSVVQDGNIKAMRFNGSTSKIDCGSYNGLTGDITISAWVKRSSVGKIAGIILDNNKFTFRGSTVNFQNNLILISDGSTVYSINVGFGFGKYFNVVGVRKSDGKTSIYINGVLMGSADQSSGTPVTGTTNILIGANNALTNAFDGNIAQVQVFSGILSANEISQLYTSQKQKFGL